MGRRTPLTVFSTSALASSRQDILSGYVQYKCAHNSCLHHRGEFNIRLSTSDVLKQKNINQ